MEILDDTYKTLSTHSEGYFRDKGSKFFAHAYHVENEVEIKTILDSIKKEYYDARHHCYAYTLGVGKSNKYRINDDGEPSGSAGRPIYGQLQSYSLSNSLIIVVRYFGGIKLGIPGLINAYRVAAKSAIDNNEIIQKIILSRVTINCLFENINLAMKVIKDESLTVVSQDYDKNNMKITIEVRYSSLERIKERINSIYGLTIEDNNSE